MKVITPRAHGWMDVAMVVVFLSAPAVAGLTGGAATLSYVLGVVHLAMTIVTEEMPVALATIVPLPLHGLVEAVVGVVVGLLGLVAFDGGAQTFFLVMAALILFAFVTTSYTEAA